MRNSVKRLGGKTPAFPDGFIEDESEKNVEMRMLSYRGRDHVHLAGLLRLDSPTLYSFVGALHSVRSSLYFCVQFNTACCAECMASGRSIALSATTLKTFEAHFVPAGLISLSMSR